MLPDVSTNISYAKRSRTDGQNPACKINLLAITYHSTLFNRTQHSKCNWLVIVENERVCYVCLGSRGHDSIHDDMNMSAMIT